MPLSLPEGMCPLLSKTGLPCKKIIFPSTKSVRPLCAMYASKARRALPIWFDRLSWVMGMYFAPLVVPLVLHR